MTMSLCFFYEKLNVYLFNKTAFIEQESWGRQRLEIKLAVA